VSSLSPAEFACPPQLSPTSMYLTAPAGKNVSIVCRVSSDPASEVNWFFNGRQIGQQTAAEEDEGDEKNQHSPQPLRQHAEVRERSNTSGFFLPAIFSARAHLIYGAGRKRPFSLPWPK